MCVYICLLVLFLVFVVCSDRRAVHLHPRRQLGRRGRAGHPEGRHGAPGARLPAALDQRRLRLLRAQVAWLQREAEPHHGDRDGDEVVRLRVPASQAPL